MSWILRKLDNLGAAIVGGGVAAALSQAPAFANAYLQRLGGRVDEARDTLARIQSGEMVPNAAPALLRDLSMEQARHLRGLEAQYAALRDASPALRPFKVMLDFNPDMAGRALADFTPALPLDIGGALWVLAGLVLGLILWELLKAPAILVWTLLDGGEPGSRTERDTPPQRKATPAPAPTPPRRREPHL